MSEPTEKQIDPQPEPQPESQPETVSAQASDAKKKKNKKKKKKLSPISASYPDGHYPEGQWMEYPLEVNSYRTTSEEMRLRDEDNAAKWEDFRKGAEIHRRVRLKAQTSVRPGMAMTEIADLIENATRQYAGSVAPLEAGIGFPTGLSVNHVAAHYTPNTGDKTVLQKDDIMKVDIGVHVNGRICDSAFTMTFNEDEKYKPLMDAVREATYTGIKEAGIDVRLNDIGEAIQEVMESYEMEENGKLLPVKCIKNLNGHSIGDYTIHSGKTVPIVANGDMTKMAEGETYAIETFGSTGRGYVIPEGECSHYAVHDNVQGVRLPTQSAKDLLKKIQDTFGTLPWCRRYLERETKEEKYLLGLNQLVRAGVVEDYPPLVDDIGAYTAQFEHTILLHPHKKEVVTKGDDY
ncbi:methionine aminopeptidase 2 [Diutina catenulata]